MPKKIFISGSAYSGKSTLIYLFEGHDKILANAIHLKLEDALINIKKNCNWTAKKTDEKEKMNKLFFFLESINKITKISEKDYKYFFAEINQHLEEYAIKKEYPNLITAFENNSLEFNFDFRNFEKELHNDLFTKKNAYISIEEFIHIFYYNFFINWKDKNFIISKDDYDSKYLVNKLPNNIESIEFILNETNESKILFVERDLIGIMKSRVLEHMKQRNLKLSDFDQCFYSISKSDFFNKAILYTDKVKKLKKNNNDRIYITSLENLIYKTKEEILNISQFCGIEYKEILIKKTHLTKTIQENTNQINDDIYKISEKSEFFVNLLIWNKIYLKRINKIYFFKYWKQFILSIYLKIKFLIIK